MIIMMMMLNIINHQLPWVVEEGFAMSESTTTSDLVTKSASIKAKKIALQFSSVKHILQKHFQYLGMYIGLFFHFEHTVFLSYSSLFDMGKNKVSTAHREDKKYLTGIKKWTN